VKADGPAGGWKERILPGGRAPLVITFAVVLAIVAAYFAYYKNQQAYYTGRNLRLLSMLTMQLDHEIDQAGEFVKTWTESGQETPIEVAKCPPQVPKLVPPAVSSRTLLPTREGHEVRWTYLHSRVRLPPATVPARYKPPAAAPQRGTPVFGCATKSLADIVRPVFDRKVAAAFDLLLIARADGTVLHSFRPSAASSTLLSTDRDEGSLSVRDQRARSDQRLESPVVVTNLAALSQRKGWRQYDSFDVASLNKATRHTYVNIDGSDYVAFTQPYTFSGDVGSQQKDQWIVCALVSAPRFRYDVAAVSTSVVLFAAGLIVLAICCWPFLRIRLIGERQPLIITDVVFMVFCSVAGTAVVTLMLLDMAAYRRIGEATDGQLETFGAKLNGDFAKDLLRASEVLARLEVMTRTANFDNVKLEEQLKADATVKKYPYIRSFAWIDEAGFQRFKYKGREEKNPRVSVRNRRYFRDARDGVTWRVGDAEGRQGEYVLEWVRSAATNEITAVMSRRTNVEVLPVLAMTTDLVNFAAAVRPPGVELAVIDEEGNVVYHSDQQRIGYENFFAETDWDADLRAAVVSRQAHVFNASYWGEDYRMYARPLEHSPWTLVTFSGKRLPRVMNFEAVLLAALLMLLNAAPYLFLYLAVLIAWPWYRAPSLWPDPTRGRLYAAVSGSGMAGTALFVALIYAVDSRSLFPIAAALPAHFAVTTYLLLHARDLRRRTGLALAAWLAASALLLLVVGRAPIDTGLLVSPAPDETRVVLILLALLYLTVTMYLFAVSLPPPHIVARTIRRAFGRSARRAVRVLAFVSMRLVRAIRRSGPARMVNGVLRRLYDVNHSVLYRVMGVVLLTIGVAVPVVAFFKIAGRAEMELLAKYAQLRSAVEIEHRISRLHHLSIAADSPAVHQDIFRYPLSDGFGSTWCIDPPASLPERVEKVPCNAGGGNDRETLGSNFADWLPPLYEESIALRQLFGSGSSDELWKWTARSHLLTLDRDIRLLPAVVEKVYTQPRAATQVIRVTSRLPLLIPWRFGWTEPAGIRTFLALVIGALTLLGAFAYVATFIARRILLIDVSEPDWLSRYPLSPTLGDHIFLVRRKHEALALTGKNAQGVQKDFVDIRFSDIVTDEEWRDALARIDRSAPGLNVRVVDFECLIDNPAFNKKKLEWLEGLLTLPDRTVIVISSVSPSFVLLTEPPAASSPEETAAYFNRWRKLLRGFVWVTEEQLELRRDESERRRTQSRWRRPETWLDEETEHNPFLRELRGELPADADCKRLIDEIGERAETYYSGLWASCTDDEKLLLYYLGHNGLANGKNRRTLRRLIARGLVRRDPNLELFSETFRLFVLSAARREGLLDKARMEQPASAWDALRLPLFIVITTLLLLLLVTQKDLMTTSTALAGALTTGLPAVLKLIGFFTERRLDTATRV
jgi:hypothetical protein